MSRDVYTQPFHIGISPPVLDDLRARLQRTRRPASFPARRLEGGSDPDYLDELISYLAR